MKTIKYISRVTAALLILGVSTVLVGCHEMKMETTLNADGSGTRHMELQVEVDEGDSLLTLADYRELMGVTAKRGWTHEQTRRKQEHSDLVKDYHSFERTAEAADLRELSGMSGDIYFRGTNEDSGFAGVHLANSIEVETGMSPRGRTIVYRETFAWSGLLEALIDYRLESFRPTLEKTYPKLTTGEITEWFAFAKGTFLVAVDDGIVNMGKGDRARRFGRSIDRVVQYAMKKINAYDPDADESSVVFVTWSIFVEWEEFDETAEDMDLLGVVLATGLDLTVRIDIPGRVVESNADRQEVYADPLAGHQKLVWEVDLEKAMSEPIEIYVKAEIPDPDPR